MQLEALTNIAAIACLVGLVTELWRVLASPSQQAPSERAACIRSPLFLPLYAGGILQWFLYGVSTTNLAISLTCGAQLLILVPLLRRHWRFHRP